MILYHGTNLDIKVIDLALCRPYKDFGRGFYTTDMPEQAHKMAALFRQYQNEWISFDTLVKSMTYKEVTSQYSFHTEKAVRLLKKEGVL